MVPRTQLHSFSNPDDDPATPRGFLGLVNGIAFSLVLWAVIVYGIIVLAQPSPVAAERIQLNVRSVDLVENSPVNSTLP